MPEQIKKSRQARSHSETENDASSATGSQTKSLAVDLDSLLDEIDEILESNAEEFVKSYVQKGGQ